MPGRLLPDASCLVADLSPLYIMVKEPQEDDSQTDAVNVSCVSENYSTRVFPSGMVFPLSAVMAVVVFVSPICTFSRVSVS